MGGKSGQTIGYKYYMSLLSGLCRGPIDELRMIKAGDEIAWDGHACSDELNFINKPDLFGGEKKEGGVQGPFRVHMGADDQVLPGAETYGGGIGGVIGSLLGVSRTLPSVKDSITSATGARVSDFRGVVTVWFDGLITAMNPYVKEWKFRVRRSKKGWYNDACWYPAKATIFLAGGHIHAMNPAHIIYECCTNPLWGRGLAPSRLDLNSFIYAANKLCAEMFGLCLIWYRKEDIDVFIQKVCDLAGMSLYTDRETGLMTLRLIRDDYDLDDLPLFTPESGLLKIVEDDAGSQDTTYNEVIGKSKDPITNTEIQERAQNLAAFQSQQAVQSLDNDYTGIPTRELLARVVQRDLRVHASGLKKYTVELDRRGWRLAPAMPFRISDPKRGIANLVLRVGELTEQGILDGKITVKAIQDVFGLSATAITTPTDSSWTRPSGEALPAAEEKLIELGYRDIYRAIGEAESEALDATQAYIGQMAAAPNGVSYQYDLKTRVDPEEFAGTTTGSFTGFGRLAADITATQTEIVFSEVQDFDAANVGQALMLEDEVLRLDAYDAETMTATVGRGCADTVPVAHALGRRAWTLDDDISSDRREYIEGETVESKVLTRTSRDVLDLDEAPTNSVELVGRHFRPYPPADVQVSGMQVYDGGLGFHDEPEITWVERNRLTQHDALIDYDDATVEAEPGTTYNARVYDLDDVLLGEYLAITSPWTYDNTMQAADVASNVVRIELESEREEVTSWQKVNFRVTLYEDVLTIDGDAVTIDNEEVEIN